MTRVGNRRESDQNQQLAGGPQGQPDQIQQLAGGPKGQPARGKLLPPHKLL